MVPQRLFEVSDGEGLDSAKKKGEGVSQKENSKRFPDSPRLGCLQVITNTIDPA